MIQSNTLGLRVETVNPGMYATNVRVDSVIEVKFNSELNLDLVPDNFLILKDTNRKYIRDNNLIVEDYEILEGLVTYKDKTIFFKPANQLDEKTRYIIYVKKKVADILGNCMVLDYISYFDTEEIRSIERPNIIEPANNSILQSLDKVVISEVDTYRYVVQISKQPTFEIVVYEQIVDGANLEREFNLGDGLYYIRARAENGEYGDATVFSIKTHRSTTPTEEDFDEDFIYEPYDEKILELIETLPALKEIQVNPKTNLMYMKFNQIIPAEEIDFYEAIVYGNYTDEDDQFDEDLESNSTLHGDVQGSFCIVYDDENEETYIFFLPESL